MAWFSLSRRGFVPVVGATLVLSSWIAADGAAAPGTGVPTGPPADAVSTGVVNPDTAATHSVTLITGDVVEYTRVPDGLPGVAIEPAPRPDGEPVTFTSYPDGDGGFLVVPSDATVLVGDGTLDEQLFDVETLIADGRANTDDPLPVIVAYDGQSAPATTRAAGRLAASEATRALETLNAVALDVETPQAHEFWADLRAGLADVEKVWLDRRMEPMLNISAATVGAPEAWAAGLDGTGARIAVIDTGIDQEHPDFADRIIAIANFTGDEDMTDHIGHGTHVASIAAGSGAASDGTFTGIAPGASLLVAKVFDETGFADTSWVIDAMEWAAEQGADVVNLSLGVCCSSGTDPASLAVNALTEQHDTLFVAAIGNDAQRERVSAPAAADHALAVAAGDKATGTRVVGISSGGPRFGDAAVKPNLTAPGDGIVAAAPGGGYITRGGTSMAAPHVAGAAALLAQQHPDWGAAELRDALQSTANHLDPGTYRWFDQGSGYLNVARLVSQDVYATSGVDLGVVDREGGPVTESVTYRNLGDEPVTLTLSVTSQGWSGNPAPAGAVSLATDTVTVPAGGEAAVELVVDPDVGAPGAFGGWVHAESVEDGVRVGTTFSYFNGPPLRLLDVSVLDGYGTTGFSTRPHHILRRTNWSPDPDNPWNPVQVQVSANEEGRIIFRVPAGEYELMTTIEELTTRGRASIVLTEHSLHDDMAVTVTPDETVPIRPVTPEPTDVHSAMVRYLRDNGDERGVGGLVLTVPQPAQLQHGIWATPLTERAVGDHLITHQWTLDSALLTSATGYGPGVPVALDPAYRPAFVGDTLAGRHQYPVVFAGDGTDLDGLDLAGALALVAIPVDPTAVAPHQDAVAAMNEALADLLAAGAAGALGYLDDDDAEALAPQVSGMALGLPPDQGRALRAAAESGGPVLVGLVGQAKAAEGYRLRYDHVSTSPTEPVVVDPAGLGRVTSHYYAHGPRDTAGVSLQTDGPGGPMSLGETVPVPLTRTLSYGPALPTTSWIRTVNHDLKSLSSRHRFQPGEMLPDEHWFRAPLVPGTPEAPADPTASTLICSVCRDGDRLVAINYWVDNDPTRSATLPIQEYPQRRLVRLGADGTEEDMPIRFGIPLSFEVPDDSARYRLESVNRSRRSLSTEVTTVAEFDSRPPTGTPERYACIFGGPCEFQPILQIGYDLPVDPHNQARAGQSFSFSVTAGSHSAVPDAPTVSDLSVEYSVDDGDTWRQATVAALPDGGFRVVVRHPELAETTGFVSLRVDASDTAGGTVSQTTMRAYALR